jgi:negative regulator of flagellin synthesis FlgM
MSIQPTDSNGFSSLHYVTQDSQSVAVNSDVEASSRSATTVAASAASEEGSLSFTDLSDQLDAASDVDWAQVDSIRQAIANGELNVDLDSLSQSILEMHQS